MKFLIIFLCLTALVSIAYGDDTTNSTKDEEDNAEGPVGNLESEGFDMLQVLHKLLPDHWMEVPLDHFNLFDNRTWQMRYKVGENHFEEGGPLFIEVGGEWKIDGMAILLGSMAELTKQHNGMMVEIEHRYYGESLPFGTNFTIENLKYLQIEQALEDIAYFVDHFKNANPKLKNSKVIIHGCSYPGMLVTWMRLRFPHIIDISYASSAPLGVGLDYPEFFEIVADKYANVHSKCIETIKLGFNQTERLLRTEEGRRKVRDAYKGWDCVDIENMNSIAILYKMLSAITGMHDPIQYEDVACLVMAMDTEDLNPYERLANFIKFKSKESGDCKNKEEPTEEETLNGVAWGYQTCTEMGTFQTLDRKNSHHPFAMDMNVQESVDECVKDFGGIVTEHVLNTGIERVTRRYGGKKPKVTKVITIQGTNDPWKHLAHLEDYTPDAPVWVIEGSHCVDVTERDDDPPQLLEVRERVRNKISEWIKEIS